MSTLTMFEAILSPLMHKERNISALDRRPDLKLDATAIQTANHADILIVFIHQ